MAHNRNSPDVIHGLDFPSDAVALDAEKLDELLRSHGVVLIHERSMRCPVGLIDHNDIRRPHEHHENCSSGFLYTQAGNATCAFLGNSTTLQMVDVGRADGSTVHVILPRFYDESNDVPMEVTRFDRFYLSNEDISVVNWETVSAHATGIDRLSFPVVSVTDLVDSSGERYFQDDDFTVKKGLIHWGSRRPGVDPKTNKGKVYSVRYRYRPYWIVKQLIHEVRVGRVEDDYGNCCTQRLPQSAILQREWVFQNEEQDENAPDPNSLRQVQSAPKGSFGPR